MFKQLAITFGAGLKRALSPFQPCHQLALATGAHDQFVEDAPSSSSSRLENGMFGVSLSNLLLGQQRVHHQQQQFETIMDGIWLMGVPKSKVTPGRKRQKWLQHVPDPVPWVKCNKCGEPKRPHRICSKNVEICAMRDSEYEEKLKSDKLKNSEI